MAPTIPFPDLYFKTSKNNYTYAKKKKKMMVATITLPHEVRTNNLETNGMTDILMKETEATQ